MSEPIAFDIASRLSDCAVLVDPRQTSQVVSSLRMMATANVAEQRTAAEARRTEMLAEYGRNSDVREKPFAFSGGVAIIPVHGVLVNRLSYSWGFVTGYNFITRMVNAAAEDPDVERIILDINSPGGTSAGCQEAADVIRKHRSKKPIIAVVDASSYSAAYWIASACSKIILTPSGGAGSIGVYSMHVDMSKMMKEYGVEITFIIAGEFKVDGNPYEKLSKTAREAIQQSVDLCYESFTSAVATNRRMDVADVKDTKARVYGAEEALALKLVDAIAPPSRALAVYEETLREDAPEDEEIEMSTQNPAPGAEKNASATPQAPAATGFTREELAAEVQKGIAAAMTAQRELRSSIMGCDEAKDRQKLASTLAEMPNMTVDTAKQILSSAAPETAVTAPKAAEPKAGDSPLDKAMNATGGGAGLAPDGENTSTPDGKQAAKPGALGERYTALFAKPASTGQRPN